MTADGREGRSARDARARKWPSLLHAGEALAVWGGVCAAVFVVFWLIEETFFSSAAGDVVQILHVVRGVSASLLSTVATAIFVLRRVAPQIVESFDDAPSTRAAATPDERLVSWFIGLRWIAVVGAVAAVAVASLVTARVSANATAPLWGGVVALFVLNAVLTLIGARRLATPMALTLQVIADVAVLGFLVHHAGGIANPFAGFFVFHAAIAAVVLDAPRARRVAFAIALFVLALSLVEAAALLPPVCLVDAAGACAPLPDALSLAASGLALAVIVGGCGFIVVALVRALHVERARLHAVRDELAARAEDLARSQVDVHREREKLQTIVDCMADAVLFVEPEGAVALHNRAALRLWPGRAPPHGQLTACHRPEKWAELRATLASPKAYELHPLFESDGRTYEASYARVLDKDGSLRGVVMVARDVTERIALQRWQMQEERMAVVGKLAAGLAHEINNPLGAIALFAEHALGAVDAREPVAEHLATILRNAEICKRIVRDLLEYSRRRLPERREVVLADVVDDVARTLEPRATAACVAIRRETRAERPPVTFGDPDQLHQVLMNLGLNAIEAMPSGGVLTFRVVSENGDGARIDVADTGVGISPEERERVFSAFHTTKAEGTGLGLAVARDIVQAHGGALDFTSAEGEGTTFSVVLPLRPDLGVKEVPR